MSERKYYGEFRFEDTTPKTRLSVQPPKPSELSSTEKLWLQKQKGVAGPVVTAIGLAVLAGVVIYYCL